MNKSQFCNNKNNNKNYKNKAITNPAAPLPTLKQVLQINPNNGNEAQTKTNESMAPMLTPNQKPDVV